MKTTTKKTSRRTTKKRGETKSATRQRTAATQTRKKATTKRASTNKVAAKKVVTKKVAAKKVAAKKITAKRATAKAAAARSSTTGAAGGRTRTGSAKKTTTSARKTTAATRAKVAKATPRKPPPQRGSAASQQLHRAIFIDVENTSSQAALLDVLESLKIDRATQVVQLTAVGNWRMIGQQMGRELAQLGARLVHSAPARGVRDWSDLWIAVAAGSWIATASPGDILEIISNDRAFDAVGDAAAARGVVYHRIPHRRGAAAPKSSTAAAPKRRSRSRRPRRSSATAEAAPTRSTDTTSVWPSDRAPHKASGEAPHGASGEQMVELVQRLAEGRSIPWVNLDVLENALKEQGFSRPPNSPRLVTRLRRMKDFEVDSHGRVRLTGATAGPATKLQPIEGGGDSERAAPARRKRRRRKPSAAES